MIHFVNCGWLGKWCQENAEKQLAALKANAENIEHRELTDEEKQWLENEKHWED